MRSPQHKTNIQPQSHQSQAETENLHPDILPQINPLLAQLSSVPNPTAHAALLQRSPANPQAILQLQRQYGNRYVNRVLQQAQQNTQATKRLQIQQQETQNSEGVISRSASGTSKAENPETIFASATKGTGTEVPFRQEMEESFEQDFSNVQTYLNQSAPMKTLGAYAATQGDKIAFTSNNPSKELVAHELAHVAQNRQTGMSNTLQGKSEISQPNSLAEQEADAVAKKAAAGQLVKVQAKPTATLQLKGEYKKLEKSAPERANKLRAEAENTYYNSAEEFEERLGYFLANHTLSMQAADIMIEKIKQIFKVWAEQTEQELNATLLKGFATKINEPAQGKVRNTINTLNYIFEQGNLREKMNLVYQSIRNQSLPEALEQARQELLQNSREAKQWKKTDLNIKYLKSKDVKNRVQPEGETKGILREYFTRKDLVEKQDREPTSNEEYQQLYALRPTVGEIAEGRKQIPLSYHELKSVYPEEAKSLKAKDSDEWKPLSKQDKGKLLMEAVQEKQLPWVGGFTQYRIGEELQQYAKNLKVILVAGHSGSTDLYMHAADYLGLNQKEKQLVRLACLGLMIPPKNHSFYEVMIVAKEYGLTDYKPEPKAYRKINPLTESDIKKGTGVKEFPDYYLSQDFLDTLVDIPQNLDESTESETQTEEFGMKPESKGKKLTIIPDIESEVQVEQTEKQKKDKRPSKMPKLFQFIKKKINF